MSETVDWQRMARTLVFQQMLQHPLPWKVERDWTYEVTANDKTVVAKCQSPEEASAIVELAEQIRSDTDNLGKVVDLIGACGDIVPPEKCNQMEGMSPDDAYRHAIGLLAEQGIEDPEAYLNQRGVSK